MREKVGQGIHRSTQEKEGEGVKCGVCEGHYGDLLVKHGELCEDDSKAGAKPYAPEKTINDLVSELEEEEANA